MSVGQLLNYCRTALSLKLSLSNPYKIAAKHCVLSEGCLSTEAAFMQRQKVNRNTFLLRFALAHPDKCLGLMVGQYVKVHKGGDSRPYIPISRIDQPGTVDFFVRDLRKQNKEKSFTTRLLDLQVGQKVQIEGPKTQYLYHGYGKLSWQGRPERKYKHIGIIAYESGITGVYNLIDSIMPNFDSQTGVSLLWIGQEADDFVFIEEFSTLAEQQRLNFNLMLRQSRPGWIGPYGAVNRNHIQSFMPPPGDQTALLLVGGPSQMDHLLPLVKQLGYNNVMEPLQSG